MNAIVLTARVALVFILTCYAIDAAKSRGKKVVTEVQ